MWLIQQEIARELEQARRSGWVPTPEQVAEFQRHEAEASADGVPRNLSIADSSAEILVEGVLTKRRDIYYSYYGRGNTSYQDIIAALAICERDASIRKVILRIDSPGGSVDGLFECIAAIESFTKPIVARCTRACSAAYAIAAACKRVEARNPASEFGCLGVAVTYFVWDDEITLTSTHSPEKRPDPRTPEGKASIVRYLDSIDAWFVEGIARGRTSAGKAMTTEEVHADFGQGATFMAPEAKKRGMIDGYAPQSAATRGTRADQTPADVGANNTAPAPSASTTNEGSRMNTKLLAQTLGLSESASAETLEAGVVAQANELRAAKEAKADAEASAKAAQDALAVIEGLVGHKGDALVGAVKGLIDARKQLDDANAKLAEQAAAAEKTKREQLIAQGKAENKLTPALIEFCASMTNEQLEAYLKVAAPVVGAEHTPAVGANGKPTSEGGALKHNGKTWPEMKPAEKAALKRDNADLYEAMRAAQTN